MTVYWLDEIVMTDSVDIPTSPRAVRIQPGRYEFYFVENLLTLIKIDLVVLALFMYLLF